MANLRKKKQTKKKKNFLLRFLAILGDVLFVILAGGVFATAGALAFLITIIWDIKDVILTALLTTLVVTLFFVAIRNLPNTDVEISRNNKIVCVTTKEWGVFAPVKKTCYQATPVHEQH